MRTVPLHALTGQAVRETLRLLCRPFRWSVWWKLWLIACLAGHMVGGFNVNLRVPWRSGASHGRAHSVTAVASSTAPQAESAVTDGTADAGGGAAMTYSTIVSGWQRARHAAATHRVWIAAGVVVYLLVWWLFVWLGARFNFVFVDAVSAGTVAVVEPFRRHRGVARSLCWWYVVVGALSGAVAFGAIWWMGRVLLADYAATPGVALDAFLKAWWARQAQHGLAVVCWIAVWLLLATVLYIWLIDFVVPIMYRRRCGVLAAWGELLRLVGRAPAEALTYLLWRGMLSIGLGVIFGVALLLAGLLVALVIALIVFVGVVVATALPLFKTALGAIGTVLAVPVAVALVVVVLLANVPLPVFFRYFSLRYLEALGVGHTFFRPEARASDAGTAAG